MILAGEVLELIEEEERILTSVLASLREQAVHGSVRLQSEAIRARELTSRIVSARNDTDRQMLASDEAVSHQLTHAKKHELRLLDRLLGAPYFARIILEEEMNGHVQEIEYKLGFAANIECRIIDWRKAPIAKLYYEYQEGDEYSEVIQGKERTGVVKLRNKLDIENGALRRISCRFGNFIRHDDGWQPVEGAYRSRLSTSYHQLPSITSLITPEQFDLITKDANSPVLIQGIAGSGKTTVALHRLAWLLHEDNSDLRPEESLVVVLSKALKSYISGVLPALGIKGVQVLTFNEWAIRTLRHVLVSADGAPAAGIDQPREKAPPGVTRVKRSLALLLAIEELAKEQSFANPPLQEVVTTVLSQPERLLRHDETRLLDRELIRQASQFTAQCWDNGRLDRMDDALFLRLHQLRSGSLYLSDKKKGRYRHIVADEVQDLSASELAVMVGAVEKTSQLTLVGDTAQEISSDPIFPGWKKLQEHWALGDGVSDIIALTVSHRSTLPIMRLADYVSRNRRTTEGRNGRKPLWFKCISEDEGVSQALGWLGRVLDRYPGTLVAVICRDRQEASHTLSLLKPTFGAAARIGDDDSFAFSEGIIVSEVRHVKGLEFPNVLIWNPSRRSYPQTANSANMLYVAITRAEENLCLSSWGQPSPLLPHVHSRLVRGVQPDREQHKPRRKKKRRHNPDKSHHE